MNGKIYGEVVTNAGHYVFWVFFFPKIERRRGCSTGNAFGKRKRKFQCRTIKNSSLTSSFDFICFLNQSNSRVTLYLHHFDVEVFHLQDRATGCTCFYAFPLCFHCSNSPWLSNFRSPWWRNKHDHKVYSAAYGHVLLTLLSKYRIWQTWWSCVLQIYMQNFPTHAPLRDPALLFSHTFSPKSAHVAGPCPQTGPCPPTGNPGSAPV